MKPIISTAPICTSNPIKAVSYTGYRYPPQVISYTVDSGKSVVDMAANFRVSELTVTRRLKLASVSPRLLAQYRKGTMTLDVKRSKVSTLA